MRSGRRERLLAAWCALTAMGITVYWITWFTMSHTQNWLPPGYLEHERVFVFTDVPLAVLLVATSVRLMLRPSGAPSLALFCAGMLTFLGVLDTAYFAQNEMFRLAHDGAANALVVAAVLALAAALVGYAATSRPRA